MTLTPVSKDWELLANSQQLQMNYSWRRICDMLMDGNNLG
jgi:hypothetical protein